MNSPGMTCSVHAVVALALLIGGCAGLGANDDVDAVLLPRVEATSEAGAPLGVELGTGTTAFEPLASGTSVDVVHGPQGGDHVWTSVRIADGAVEHATVELSARFARSGELAGPPTRVAVTLTPDGSRRMACGLQTLIARPSAVKGESVILRADVRAEDGRAGFDARSVVPR
jgi:hypothetical protein